MFTKHKAFTLIELLICLAIVAVLVGISYPLYRSHLATVRRADAQLSLLKLSGALENYYLDHHTYRGATFSTLHFPEYSPQGFYRMNIVLEQDAQSYQVQAIPQGDQAKLDKACGIIVLATDGRRTYVGTDPKAVCW